MQRVNLRRARNNLRLSQQEAAAMGKVHRNTVVRWEEGQAGINANSRGKLKRYCLALAQYAVALGLNKSFYQPHTLCPGEFPVPEHAAQENE